MLNSKYMHKNKLCKSYGEFYLHFTVINMTHKYFTEKKLP